MKVIKQSTAKFRLFLIFYHSLALSDEIVQNVNSSQVFYDAHLSSHILISTLQHFFPCSSRCGRPPGAPNGLSPLTVITKRFAGCGVTQRYQEQNVRSTEHC